MSSWYDPPEDGDGCITGPDFFITAQDDNDEREIVLAELDHLPDSVDKEIKSLVKDGVEVYVRWGCAWAKEETGTWYYAISYDAAYDAVDKEFGIEREE